MLRSVRCGLLPLWVALLLAGGARPAGADEVQWNDLFNRGLAPLRIGALPRGIASASFEECETCHVTEAREWRESLHRRSWTQPLFQAALAIEPMPECRNCHRPLTPALQSEGINCVTCHVRDGVVYSATISGRAPHASRAAALLSRPDFCGGCHQFPFPDRRGDGKVHHGTEPMQDTLAEWRGTARGETCQDCHMPWVTGPGGTRHRSHRFPGGYDEQMLGRAVEARAELVQKPDALLLKMVLRAQDVGHKVPTGDLFRSLVLDATLTDGNGNPLPGAVSVQSKLARTFGTIVVPDDRGELRVRRHQLRDDRLVPGEDRVLTLRLPLPAPRREKLGVRYRLRLFRLPPGLPRSGTEGEITKVKEGLLLASPGETS